MFTYTAQLYFDNIKINNRSGDDLESLFVWMITQAQGKFGNLNGKITNNQTHFLEKEFRTCAYD